MTLKTQLSSDMSTFFNTDEFAESVTYEGSAIDAVVTAWTDHDEGDSPRVETPDLGLIVQVADVTLPVTGDAVIVSAVTYRVADIVHGDNSHTWFLGLIKRFS
jgi:hypothetical protein